MKLPAVLSVLRDAQQHLAIVTDEYGGTLGVVSMEDILEQLVGDIWDETDTVRETVIRRDDDSFEMDGDAPVSEMLELMNWSEDEFDYASETVGGWCIEYLDYFPQVNEKFDFKDIEITVLEVDERRVRKVRLQPKKNIS
jgi:CBS domain containing-hemolysin-like protein